MYLHTFSFPGHTDSGETADAWEGWTEGLSEQGIKEQKLQIRQIPTEVKTWERNKNTKRLKKCSDIADQSYIFCYFNFTSLIIFAKAPKLLGQEEEDRKSKPPGFKVEALWKDYSLDMTLYEITYKALNSSGEDVALLKQVIKGTSATAF